jgi:murein L,D-transpeptidase YcbB/YkuD
MLAVFFTFSTVVAAQSPPSWIADGRPTAQAVGVVAFMHGVASRGLRESDYQADSLGVQAQRLAAGRTLDTAAAARFDAELSRALVRLLTHLHAGRVTPRALGFQLPDTHGALDFAAMARDVSRSPDVRAAITLAEPRYAGYSTLLRALARYRALATDSTLHPPAPPVRSPRPGESYADAPALRRWLEALGDYATERAAVPDSLLGRYDSALVRAVQRFQARHGLDTNGTLGPATVAALRVPFARRVRQIELALERWRWLPDVPPARYAVVNIPAFRLYIFENDSAAARPVMRMNVIVGREYAGRRTPVFTATMEQVVLHPFWDVPVNIARSEMLPHIRRDPGYLAREALEIVSGDDEHARIFPPTSANLARVSSGSLRIRQRPGDKNALGPAKFLFPNDHNVYLHGTPSRALFGDTRRDFSHGCIRVQDPAGLAELVLQGQPEWNRAAIDAAMAGTRTRRIPVARPIGVFILYATVVVADDDIVRFYPDIYGHDTKLERALTAPPPGNK